MKSCPQPNLSRVLLASLCLILLPLPLQAAPGSPVTVCPPAKAKEIGVRPNKNLPQAEVSPEPRFFRWSMGGGKKPLYNLEIREQTAQGKNTEEAKATARIITRSGSISLADQPGGKDFSEAGLMTVSEESVFGNLKPSPDSKDSSEDLRCIFDTVGRQTTQIPCLKGTLRTEYTLPRNRISPKQTEQNFIELPFSAGPLKGELNIKEEILLLDYIKVNGRTLARLLKRYSLLNAMFSSEIKECPAVYFSGASTVYYDLEKHSPHMITQFTRFQIDQEDFVQRTDRTSKLSLKNE